MKTVLDAVHPFKISYNEKEGRWNTRIPDPTKSRGTRQIKRSSKEELFSFLIEFYGVTEPESQKETTFRDLFHQWIEYKRGFIEARSKPLSPYTIERIERDYEQHLAFLSDYSLTELKAGLLEEKLIEMVKKNNGQRAKQGSSMKKQCLENIWSSLKGMFDYAMKHGYIEFSLMIKVDRKAVFAFCEIDPVKTKTDDERILSHDELSALKEAIKVNQKKKPHYIPDYAGELATLTGMRRGELVALHWGDIRNGKIHVDYSEHLLTFSDKPSVLVIREPKNQKHRTIPLTAEMKDLFARVKSLGHHSEEDFVFVDQDGKRATGQVVAEALKRRAKEAGIDTTSIHEVRRTVSSILRQTLPTDTVASLMGHNPEMNTSNYAYDVARVEEKIFALEGLSKGVTIRGVTKSNQKRQLKAV